MSRFFDFIRVPTTVLLISSLASPTFADGWVKKFSDGAKKFGGNVSRTTKNAGNTIRGAVTRPNVNLNNIRPQFPRVNQQQLINQAHQQRQAAIRAAQARAAQARAAQARAAHYAQQRARQQQQAAFNLGRSISQQLQNVTRRPSMPFPQQSVPQHLSQSVRPSNVVQQRPQSFTPRNFGPNLSIPNTTARSLNTPRVMGAAQELGRALPDGRSVPNRVDFRQSFNTIGQHVKAAPKRAEKAVQSVAKNLEKPVEKLQDQFEMVGHKISSLGKQGLKDIENLGDQFEFDADFDAVANHSVDAENALYESIRGARGLDPYKKDSHAARELGNFNDYFIVERPEPVEEEEEPTREEALQSMGYTPEQIALMDQVMQGELSGPYLQVYEAALDRRFRQLLDEYLLRYPGGDVNAVADQLWVMAADQAGVDLLNHYGMDANGDLLNTDSDQQAVFLARHVSKRSDEWDTEDYTLDGGNSDDIPEMQSTDAGSWIESKQKGRGRGRTRSRSPKSSSSSVQQGPTPDLETGDRYDSGKSKSKSSFKQKVRALGEKHKNEFKRGLKSDLRRAAKSQDGQAIRVEAVRQAKIRQQQLKQAFAPKKLNTNPFPVRPSQPGRIDRPNQQPTRPWFDSGRTRIEPQPGGYVANNGAPRDNAPRDNTTRDNTPRDNTVEPANYKEMFERSLNVEPFPEKPKIRPVPIDSAYIDQFGELVPNPYRPKLDEKGRRTKAFAIPDPDDHSLWYVKRPDGLYVMHRRKPDGSWLEYPNATFTSTVAGLEPGTWPEMGFDVEPDVKGAEALRKQGRWIGMDNEYIKRFGKQFPDPRARDLEEAERPLVQAVPDPYDDDIWYMKRGPKDDGFVKHTRDKDGRWKADHETVYWRSPAGLIPGDWPKYWDNFKSTGLMEVAEFPSRKGSTKQPSSKELELLRKGVKLANRGAKVIKALAPEDANEGADKYTRQMRAAQARRESDLEMEVFFQQHGHPMEHGELVDPLRTRFEAHAGRNTYAPSRNANWPKSDGRSVSYDGAVDAAREAHSMLQRVKRLRLEEQRLMLDLLERPTDNDNPSRRRRIDDLREQRELLEPELKDLIKHWQETRRATD